MSDTEKLREQNDAFRRTLIGGVVRFRGLLQWFSRSEKQDILRLIREFNDFRTDNGHQSEHDFGALKYLSTHIFWAIHYQDVHDIGKPSPAPADPTKTQRLMQIVCIPWDDPSDDYDDRDDDDGTGSKRLRRYKPEQEELPR